MKTIITFLLCLGPVICSSQQLSNSANQSRFFELGITSSYVFNSLDYPKRYHLTSYSDPTTLGSSNTALMFQAIGRLYFQQFYLSSSMGIATGHTNETSTTSEATGNAGVGGYWTQTKTRELYLDETNISFAGSLEAGYLFLKPTNRFNFGFGIGADFITNLTTHIKRNELIVYTSGSSYSNPPSGPSTSSYSYEETFGNESAEWKQYVQRHDIGIIQPKISLLARYSITKKLSISIQPQVRLLFINYGIDRAALDFPLSLGVLYRF